jgi:hypothetical protein
MMDVDSAFAYPVGDELLSLEVSLISPSFAEAFAISNVPSFGYKDTRGTSSDGGLGSDELQRFGGGGGGGGRGFCFRGLGFRTAAKASQACAWRQACLPPWPIAQGLSLAPRSRGRHTIRPWLSASATAKEGRCRGGARCPVPRCAAAAPRASIPPAHAPSRSAAAARPRGICGSHVAAAPKPPPSPLAPPHRAL